MQASDYGIPADFRHWQGDPAEDHIGPFFYRRVDDRSIETALRLQSQHCNSHRSVHGGVLMAFIDYTLCVAAVANGEDEGVVTVSCNTEFVDGAQADTLVYGHGEVIRRTGSLVFTRGQIKAEDGRVLLNASAVVKRIRRRERRAL